MPYRIESVVTIKSSETITYYYISPKHRRMPTWDISVWAVSFQHEVDCFRTCYANGWHDGSYGWSFILDGPLNYVLLGHNLRNPNLRIAKFSLNHDRWHGYPADLRNKPADKPIPSILFNWLNNGHISKATMTRIKQGQL